MATRIDHVARRRELALAAMSLFSKKGYDNVSLQELTSVVGLSRTVLYREFDGKRDVFSEAVHANTRAIMEACRTRAAGAGRPLEKVRDICDDVLDRLHDRREFLTAIYDFVLAMNRRGEAMASRVFSFTNGLRTVLTQLLESAKRSGEAVSGLSPSRTAELLVSILESGSMRIVLGMETGTSEAKQRIADVLVRCGRKGCLA